jgi:hypothetical protein
MLSTTSVIYKRTLFYPEQTQCVRARLRSPDPTTWLNGIITIYVLQISHNQYAILRTL